MHIEQPFSVCVIARLSNPEVNLQAFGGLIIAVGFLIECPVWNLLGTSAALVRSKQDFIALKKYVFYLSGFLTLLLGILLLGFASDLLEDVMGAPRDVAKVGREGLVWVIFWPFVVGYRRICQGVFVSSGRSKFVTYTSIIRVISILCFFIFILWHDSKDQSAIQITLASTMSLTIETLLCHLLFKRYVFQSLPGSSLSPLTLRGIVKYTNPLILAVYADMLTVPLGTAMLYRMPEAERSLVVLPLISTLLVMMRTPAMAFIELASAAADKVENEIKLKQLALKVAVVLTGATLVFLLPSIGELYFSRVAGLSPENAHFAYSALPFGILMIPFAISIYLQEGISLAKRKPKLLFEATLLCLAIMIFGCGIGISFHPMVGVHWYLMLMSGIFLSQALWLRYRLKTA